MILADFVEANSTHLLVQDNVVRIKEGHAHILNQNLRNTLALTPAMKAKNTKNPFVMLGLRYKISPEQIKDHPELIKIIDQYGLVIILEVLSFFNVFYDAKI